MSSVVKISSCTYHYLSRSLEGSFIYLWLEGNRTGFEGQWVQYDLFPCISLSIHLSHRCDEMDDMGFVNEEKLCAEVSNSFWSRGGPCVEFVQILCLPWEPMCRDEFHDPCICLSFSL